MTMVKIQLATKTASALVIGVGGVLALAALPTMAGPTAFLADLIFWPYDGHPTLDAPAARLLAAISGGVMVGWGVLLWLVATRVLPADPVLGASLIRTSAITWFAVDSFASVLAGAPVNVVLNAVFLAAFLVPLAYVAPRQAT